MCRWLGTFQGATAARGRAQPSAPPLLVPKADSRRDDLLPVGLERFIFVSESFTVTGEPCCAIHAFTACLSLAWPSAEKNLYFITALRLLSI